MPARSLSGSNPNDAIQPVEKLRDHFVKIYSKSYCLVDLHKIDFFTFAFTSFRSVHYFIFVLINLSENSRFQTIIIIM